MGLILNVICTSKECTTNLLKSLSDEINNFNTIYVYSEEKINIPKTKNIIIKKLHSNYIDIWSHIYPKHYNDSCFLLIDKYIYPIDIYKVCTNIKYKAILNLFENRTYYTLYTGINLHKLGNILNCGPIIFKKMDRYCYIPPKTFPLDAVNKENLKIYKDNEFRCDISWLDIFLKYNKIAVNSLNLITDNDIIDYDLNYDISSKRILNTVSVEDYETYFMLRVLPNEFMSQWKNLFPLYNTTEFDNLSINDLRLWLNVFEKKFNMDL